MFTLTASLPSEDWCASVLRNVRWKKGKTVCPRCSSPKVKKDGHYRSSYQKYFCKACGRSFNDKTGTLFNYSHTPLNRWFLAIYLFFVLWMGCSIREISLEAMIPYFRCYRFIRTVMERLLFLSILRHEKLKGKVESDEFYTKAGLKGRSYHEEIVRLGREPRCRGLKAWKGRGTFEKDFPMVTCMHQRETSKTYFDVPVRRRSLVDLDAKTSSTVL